MLAIRTAVTARAFSSRAFSTTPRRAADLAKLTLIGHLTRDPETRLTKRDKEFVTYTVATSSPSPPDVNGERLPPTTTFHRILCFNEGSSKYLRSLRKGSRVYVETSFEIKEPEPEADPTTPQGQRQIFLRHETIRVLNNPKRSEHSEESVEPESYPL
ncbi:hypothetical protein B0H34DRAFT_221589 [Crassisporium funariophilum]|nr:hypothetical protein B0H34DRAFT_221589 [Crassisporium funariophilum]